jgi:hypothetical protein
MAAKIKFSADRSTSFDFGFNRKGAKAKTKKAAKTGGKKGGRTFGS